MRGPWRALRTEQERTLLARAIARGLLRAEQLEQAEQQVREGDSLVAHLVETGVVDPGALDAVERELMQEEFVRPAASGPAELPDEVRQVSSDPDRHVGSFVLVNPVGRGGSGEVWRAWDRSLGRFVAIKLAAFVVHARADVERFEREGLASARLAHPNILSVYQVGTHRGRPYLVMPYLEGHTLDGHQLPVPRAIEVAKDVARAIAHAHERGVVHRDVKPGNVMLDPEGRVHVLDFGLVHLLEHSAQHVTRPGDVMGTAAFMSPEQARGAPEARAPATDVYGIGATLHALLTGRAPFAGDSFASIVAQVGQDEPVPLSHTLVGVSRELEAVVAKAMAKDPRLRYASAQEVADDLERLIAGLPVRARPVGRLSRLARTVARNRMVALALLGATMAAGGAAAVRWRAGVARVQALDSLRELAHSSLETALKLRRAGDLPGMRQTVDQLAPAFDRARERMGEVAEIDYLIGRMHRALGNDQAALEAQHRALALEPLMASALYERALLNSKRYGLEASRVAIEPLPVVAPVRRLAEIERRQPDLAVLRGSIVRDLTRMKGLWPTAATLQAASGISAYHQGDPKAARELLQAAVRRDPSREEAWEHLARAAAADGDLDAAEMAYDMAIGLDRGYLPHRVGRCQVRLDRNKLQDALEDAAQALSMDERSVDALVCRGTARARIGRRRRATDAKALEDFASAEVDFVAAIATSPRLARAWLSRGTLQRYRAAHRENLGQDPVPELEAGQRYQSRALEIEPRNPTILGSRGRTRSALAFTAMLRGQDSRELVAAARADLDAAIAIAPGFPNYWQWRGEISTEEATQLVASRPHDALAKLETAEHDLARAFANQPRDLAGFFAHRGATRIVRGRALAAAGREPFEAWNQAQNDLDRALSENEMRPDIWTKRAVLHAARADHLQGRQFAAREQRAAERDFARAIALDQGHATAWAERGKARLRRGDRRGRDDLRRAVTLRPEMTVAIDAWTPGRGVRGEGE